MALAETANLITRLTLQDQLTPGLAKAQAGTNAFGKGANVAATGVTFLQKAGGQLQGALGTLGTRLGQIAGAAGIVGLTGGLFSLGVLLKDSVAEAKSFGGEVNRLRALTGLSADSASALASAFHHFGIEADTVATIAGMAEKNIFRLGGTTKSAEAFHKKYNLSLTDSHGKLLDFNALILRTSDYFLNKNIPASEKAAALAAIYGRNWQAIIPILGAGRAQIASVEEEAARLGLTLTSKNLKALRDLRDASRGWGTALAGLKLQIGLTLVPILTDLAKGATQFLASGGRERIVAFIQGLVGVGRTVAQIFQSQVIPTVQRVIHTWNSIPAPLRGLLARGITGNYVIRFLTGIDPIGLAGGAAAAIGARIAGGIAGLLISKLGGFFGNLFGGVINKGVPQLVAAVAPIPVFVTNPGFGIPGAGGPGGILESAGTKGLLATFLASGTLPLAALALAAVGVAGLLIFHPGTDPKDRVPGFTRDPTTGTFERTGGFDRTAAYGQRLSAIQTNTLRTSANIERQAVREAAAAAAAARQRAAGLAATAAAARVIATGNAQRLATSARQVAAVQAAARSTVGSEARVERATSAAASRLAALHNAGNAIQRGVARAATITHQRVAALEGVDRATAVNTGVIARHGPPKVSVGVTVNTTVSVSAIAQQLTRVTTGMYAGKLVPL